MLKRNYACLAKYAPEEILEQPDFVNNAGLPLPWPFTKFGKSLDNMLKEKDFIVKKREFEVDVRRCGILKRVYENPNESIGIEYYHYVPIEKKLEEPITFLGELRKTLDRIPEDENKLKWINRDEFVIGAKGFYDMFSRDELGYFRFDINTKQSSMEVSSEDGFSYAVFGNVSENDLSKFLLKKDNLHKNQYKARYHVDEFPINEEDAGKYIFEVVSNLTKK